MALAAPLARAAAAFARLDMRLRTQPADRRAGGLRHLALVETTDRVWAEGHRLRPERLALVDLDRPGRTGTDAAALGRAAAGLRCLLTPRRRLDCAEAVALALGHRVLADGIEATLAHPDPVRDLLPPLAKALADAWLADLADLDAHPLTRAGAGFRAWQRGDLGRFLEAAELASHLALAPTGANTDPALTFLPLAFGGPPTDLRLATSRNVWLAAWYETVARAANSARNRLESLDVWRTRATAVTAEMSGRGAPALADLFLARPRPLRSGSRRGARAHRCANPHPPRQLRSHGPHPRTHRARPLPPLGAKTVTPGSGVVSVEPRRHPMTLVEPFRPSADRFLDWSVGQPGRYELSDG